MAHERPPVRHLFRPILAAVVLTACLLPACGDDDDGDNHLVEARVTAAAGATVTAPGITLTIPAGAMDRDATVTIDPVSNPPAVGTNQTAASPAFAVSITGSTVLLSEPIVVEIAVDAAPVHPQIAEVAQLDGADQNVWQRVNANFYRTSDQTVVALVEETTPTLRAVYRTLQTTSGAAVDRGREVFLHATFGNENFFGDVVGLHTLLNNVAPVDAVALGAQVDLTKVPQGIVDVMIGSDLAAKDAALVDPATTRALIKAGAVVGVEGFYASDDPADDTMVRAGITCALCHVTVAPTTFELTGGPTALPIGPPNLDGVPNSAMNAGAILALTPFAQGAGQETVDLLNSWGPGAFDIRALPDNPLDDGVNNPTAYPPIWNFPDLTEQGHPFGWDGLFLDDGTHDNALASQAEAVYDLVMHGNGAFATASGNLPPELAITPPQELLDALAAAESAAPGNDVVTDDLLDLQAWMRSIASPAPADYDEAMAEMGFKLFYGRANCVACHHTAELAGTDLHTDVTAAAPTGGLAGGIHVPGLRGIRHTAPYFHDNSAATLAEVVARLVARGGEVPNDLTATEQAALVEYLSSL